MTTQRPLAAGGKAPAFPAGLPLVRPTIECPAELARDLETVLGSGSLTNGARVRDLEESIASRIGVPHVIAVSSCTAGLMLVWHALDVRGKVLMPSFTFSASAHAVSWAGAVPHFVDVEPRHLTLDPASVEGAAPDAAAICATHLYGTPCDTEALQAIADERSIPLVYDAAHALGSQRGNQAVGGFGDAEVFSLSPTKVVVAGEGGIVATRRADLAEVVRLGRDYGNPGDYDCRFPGLNARMSELHAVTALHSLRKLDLHLEHRRNLVATMRRECAGIPGLCFPAIRDGDLTTYKDLTLIVVADEYGLSAAALASVLRAEGIDTRHYYRPPIHRQQAYRHLPTHHLPVTDLVTDQVISVPLWSHMSERVIRKVADVLAAVHEHAALIRHATRKDNRASPFGVQRDLGATITGG